MIHWQLPVRKFTFSAVFLLFLCSCNHQKARQPEETTPQVFTPENSQIPVDSINETEPTTEPEKHEQLPMNIEKPDLKKLGQLTPNQEAKRALTNDAFKATKMDLTEFGTYMQSRIPYYRNKGDLKFENDIVRIHINGKEMVIQTIKGRLTYPMQ